MCVQDYEDDFDDDAESSAEDSETPEPAVKKPSSKRVRFVPAWVLLSPVMTVTGIRLINGSGHRICVCICVGVKLFFIDNYGSNMKCWVITGWMLDMQTEGLQTWPHRVAAESWLWPSCSHSCVCHLTAGMYLWTTPSKPGPEAFVLEVDARPRAVLDDLIPVTQYNLVPGQWSTLVAISIGMQAVKLCSN